MSTLVSYLWDESKWPVVRLDLPKQSMTRTELDAFLVRYSRLFERKQPFVLLFELGAGAPFSAEYRDVLRRYTREHEAEIAEHQRGVGIVATSGFHRATARALLWIVQPPFVVELFTDWPSAYRWAEIAARTSRASRTRRYGSSGSTELPSR